MTRTRLSKNKQMTEWMGDHVYIYVMGVEISGNTFFFQPS